MKNVEKADRIHLGSLMEELKKGHFVIPDFQREFEWQPWDVLDLIKSIFMDYYIGTLLLWKGSKENYKMLSCDPIYAFNGKDSPQHIVLDGQQRLTAIYYAFFQPEEVFPGRAKPMAYFMNIQSFLDDDFEKTFWYDSLTKKNIKLLANNELQFEQHIFPLGVMKEGTWGTSDWIKAYRDYWQTKADEITGDDEEGIKTKSKYLAFAESAKKFKDAIEEIFNQYYISYIELDRDIDVAKVCDIFTQINSKGVSLDIFDLLNAILRPKDIYLKKLWHEAEDALSYTDAKKMKIYVLQVMSILEQSYCSAKYLYYLVPEATKTIKKSDGTKEKIVLVQDTNDFLKRWEAAVKALNKAIQSLKSPRDYGAITPAFVPYPSIIPAFAAIKSYVDGLGTPNKLDIQIKIRKWYWASVFTNRYSSSVESSSAKDFQDLKKWFEDSDAEPEVIADFIGKYKTIDLMNENPKGSAIYNAIFNLFVINEARDWSTFDLPEYESLDDHHIVPYSIFKDIAGSSINSILNRTPISADTNRRIIKARMPNEYIKEMLKNNDPERVYGVLASHLISKKAVDVLLRNPFTKEDFEEFLSIRQETIRDAIENLLIKEKIDIPVALQSLNIAIENIELQLRSKIVSTIGDELEVYKFNTPSHIQEKVDKRVSSEIKKKPGLSLEDFNSFSERLKYFDLFELYEFLTSKSNWASFEDKFKNKEQLQNRFNQLSTLRNCIRHSRDVTSVEKLDGEAAIAWFNEIL
jgi:hypothetical protein